MTRILLVEDDPVIRHTVEYSLKRAGFAVSTATDGSTAIELVARERPDLVLLDIMLPLMDGYEVAERLRAEDPETAIIMVSALDHERDKVRAMDVGADDYITKPFSMEELLARIRAKLRRVRIDGALVDERIMEHADLVVELKSFRVFVGGQEVRLRLKEFQLLVALAERRGQLVTRNLLADEVWGYEHMSTSRTIDVHIRRLRQAIEDVSDFLYIHTVHGAGYRFEPIAKAAHPVGEDVRR